MDEDLIDTAPPALLPALAAAPCPGSAAHGGTASGTGCSTSSGLLPPASPQGQEVNLWGSLRLRPSPDVPLCPSPPIRPGRMGFETQPHVAWRDGPDSPSFLGKGIWGRIWGSPAAAPAHPRPLPCPTPHVLPGWAPTALPRAAPICPTGSPLRPMSPTTPGTGWVPPGMVALGSLCSLVPLCFVPSPVRFCTDEESRDQERLFEPERWVSGEILQQCCRDDPPAVSIQRCFPLL